MLIEILDQKHPEYDAEAWADLGALYAGGKKFRQRLYRFLDRNTEEPDGVYAKRCRQAHYRSYMGPITDYYASWLFSDEPVVRSVDELGAPVEIDKWYAEFKEDVGGDTDLSKFLHDRFRSALVTQIAYWIVELPGDDGKQPADMAEFKQRNLGDATLQKLDRADLYDWECDQKGRMLYAVTHDIRVIRPSLASKRDQVVETWKTYDDTDVETFELRYQLGKRPPPTHDVPSTEKRKHGAKQLPIVRLLIPEGLCIGLRTESAQLEHFRLSAALSWAIRQCCYPMPVFHSEDENRPPTMGAGYYITVSLKESFEWSSPDAAPFAVISKEIDGQREEIYRITNQLSQSVNTRQGGSAQRSAESKNVDLQATQILLGAYAKEVRQATELTYEIVSDARGDRDTTFDIAGLSNWDTEGPTEILTNAGLAATLAIPSRTFNAELKTRAAFALVPDIDQHKRDAIRKEIEEGVENDSDMADAMKAAMVDNATAPPTDTPGNKPRGSAPTGMAVPNG